MSQSPRLGLPYLVSGQAQKEVTHNDALNGLDFLVQLNVLDRDLNTPPASPTEGDTYIIGPSPQEPGRVRRASWPVIMPDGKSAHPPKAGAPLCATRTVWSSMTARAGRGLSMRPRPVRPLWSGMDSIAMRIRGFSVPPPTRWPWPRRG